MLPESSQLQRRERDKRAEDAENPEPNDHLRLAPALHLEMVMQRRAQENPMRARIVDPVFLLAVLEHAPLDDHRGGLGDEYTADEKQQELGLQQDRDDAERAAEGERSGVPHEYLRRVRVEPQKADARTKDRGAEDHELP